MALLNFLLIYGRVRGVLAEEPEVFVDPADAADADEQTELRYRGDPDMEIVLIGSDSIETVRRPHRNYFAGGDPFPFVGVSLQLE